jgi:zinc protease
MPAAFQSHTLANGLKVMLKEIHTAPIISHWVWYRVGSRDERPGITGVSHWVEHMLFKGTAQFPAGELDKAISRDGGFWNAMTYIDWTTYFETMPAARIDLAMRLEADRMRNSLFEPEEVASERTVIISERQGNENNPMFRLDEEMQAAAFRVHSYHHEVIGDMADLESLSRDDLYNHYRSFYVPNNAILCLAGDFDSRRMLARIKALYGDIPAGEEPVRVARPEPAQAGERRITVEGPGETTFIRLGYRAPVATNPDFFPLMVLDSLLAGASSLNMFGGGISNRTSRLYRELIEKDYAVSVSGALLATIDPFLYSLTIVTHPTRTVDEVLAAIDEQIAAVQAQPPTQAEIERAVKQARALFAYGSESITNQAFWLGFAEIFADYNWFLSYVEKLAEVTPEDVQRVAQQYLAAQNRTVGIYLPTGMGELEGWDE